MTRSSGPGRRCPFRSRLVRYDEKLGARGDGPAKRPVLGDSQQQPPKYIAQSGN